MPAEAAKIITQAHVKGVDVIRIGTVTEAPELKVEGTVSLSLAELRKAHEAWFPAYMANELASAN